MCSKACQQPWLGAPAAGCTHPLWGRGGDVRLTHWVLFDWCQLRGVALLLGQQPQTTRLQWGGPKAKISRPISLGQRAIYVFAVKSRRGHSFNKAIQKNFKHLTIARFSGFHFLFPETHFSDLFFRLCLA